MSELSARARALVDRARQQATPSAEELSHLRAKLTAGLASQSPDPVLVPLWLGKLAGLAMLGAVGLGAWYLRGMLAEHERRAPTPQPIVVQPAPSCPAPPPAVWAPVLVPVPMPEAGKPAVTQCAPPEESQAKARARRGLQENLFTAEVAQKDPSLELQLLVLARVALDEERSTDALGHMQRHEQLYPQSAFEEERLAIQVLAYCAAGNHALATQHYERLVELAPHSTYLPRVKGTCGEGFGP